MPHFKSEAYPSLSEDSKRPSAISQCSQTSASLASRCQHLFKRGFPEQSIIIQIVKDSRLLWETMWVIKGVPFLSYQHIFTTLSGWMWMQQNKVCDTVNGDLPIAIKYLRCFSTVDCCYWYLQWSSNQIRLIGGLLLFRSIATCLLIFFVT